MRLEDYFEFEKLDTKYGTAESIRIKGHRIEIDAALERYLAGQSPQEIIEHTYPTLTLEEVQATIAYYQQNQKEVDAYLQRGKAITEAYYQEYLQRGPYFLR